VCRVLLISELHPLCTVCTTIAPRVLHFSAVHLLCFRILCIVLPGQQPAAVAHHMLSCV